MLIDRVHYIGQIVLLTGISILKVQESVFPMADSQTVASSGPDFTAWDACVKAHVKQGEIAGISLNTVDYSGEDDPNFSRFVKSLETATTSGLGKDAEYSLWINAYNALAIKTVTDNPCKKKYMGLMNKKIEGIKDVGSLAKTVWKRPAGVVGGRMVSLDDIENEELRNPKDFPADPRLHACIVCASVSCPDVAMKAYMPETLEEDMSENLRAFLRNTKKGLSLNKSTGVLTLSKIFQWFANDFIKTGQSSVVEYLLPFIPSEDQAWIAENKDKIKLEYFDYNWSLNGISPGEKGTGKGKC
ncbi:unnamed protein product [Choristocarpus tenellus]